LWQWACALEHWQQRRSGLTESPCFCPSLSRTLSSEKKIAEQVGTRNFSPEVSRGAAMFDVRGWKARPLLASSPKSIIQTSPGFMPRIFVLHPVEHQCPSSAA